MHRYVHIIWFGYGTTKHRNTEKWCSLETTRYQRYLSHLTEQESSERKVVFNVVEGGEIQRIQIPGEDCSKRERRRQVGNRGKLEEGEHELGNTQNTVLDEGACCFPKGNGAFLQSDRPINPSLLGRNLGNQSEEHALGNQSE